MRRPSWRSVGLVLLTSSAVLFFRKTLFSLPRAELRQVTLLHVVRIVVSNGLNALCWHLALPDVGVEWWLLLSAMRLLISRLPFVPNKDVVFAGVAVFLIGHDAEIGTLMTMMATLILATHHAARRHAGHGRGVRLEEEMTLRLLVLPLLLAAAAPALSAPSEGEPGYLRSTPDLGKAEGQCRPGEKGPAVLITLIGLKDRAGHHARRGLSAPMTRTSSRMTTS